MTRHQTHQIDNRDSEQMFGYLEARVEAMKRRISELEMENQSLRLFHSSKPSLGCGQTSGFSLTRTR